MVRYAGDDRSDRRRRESTVRAAPTCRSRADWQRDALEVVAFVQEQRGRTILGAAAVPLKNARAVKEYSYWLDTLDRADDGRGLTESGEHADRRPAVPRDVVVIGAGYTGLAAARQLARAGASVVVLEREQVGWGASSRNGGQVLTGLKVDPGDAGRALRRIAGAAAVRRRDRVDRPARSD